MKVRHTGSSLTDVSADLLVVCVHGAPSRSEIVKELDAALEGRLLARVKALGMEGKPGESATVYSGDALSAEHLRIVGAGPEKDFRPAALKDMAADAVRAGGKLGAKTVVFALPAGAAQDLERATELAATGAQLGAYRFDKYRHQSKKPPLSVGDVQIATAAAAPSSKAPTARALTGAVRRGEAISQAVAQARDFVNIPAGDMTPAKLATEARAIARKHGLTAKVLGAAECKRLGMGMFLDVAKGSAREPKFIHLVYKPKSKPKKRVALVGKGIMFDSGGYSLKPTSGMLEMKADMSGAAAVIAAMGAVAALKVPYEVHAIAACCENMISGEAYKLGDVIKGMDGTTVEVTNTDAEGRLTLGDAITYARQKVKPDQIFDFATLTGACMVALGPYTAAVLSNDDDLAEKWLEASRAAGEDMWQMPLNTKLGEQLKSPIADMKNAGDRFGGAITAGLFLKNFVKDSPWVHVDIAGPATSSREQGAWSQGGTGFSVATIAEYLRD